MIPIAISSIALRAEKEAGRPYKKEIVVAEGMGAGWPKIKAVAIAAWLQNLLVRKGGNLTGEFSSCRTLLSLSDAALLLLFAPTETDLAHP